MSIRECNAVTAGTCEALYVSIREHTRAYVSIHECNAVRAGTCEALACPIDKILGMELCDAPSDVTLDTASLAKGADENGGKVWKYLVKWKDRCDLSPLSLVSPLSLTSLLSFSSLSCPSHLSLLSLSCLSPVSLLSL